jgi:hypothetical protein
MKLGVLGVTTFGAYVIYWFYRNWLAIRLIEQRPGIMPAWRVAFMPLWVFNCFRRLGLITGQSPMPAAVIAAVLAVLNLLLALIWFAGPPLSLLSVLILVSLLPINARLRRFKRTQGVMPSRRERFTLWNWLWAVPVGFLQLLNVAWALIFFLLGSPSPR